MIANVIVSSSPTSGIFFSVKNLEKFSKYSTCTSFESESDPEKKKKPWENIIIVKISGYTVISNW